MTIRKKASVLVVVLTMAITYNIYQVKYLDASQANLEALKDAKQAFIDLDNAILEGMYKTKAKQDKLIKEQENTIYATTTAYNVGDINQCWGDPCISANGENICDALDRGEKRCAANFVPFGTVLNIEGYGNCVVTDRMNKRYSKRVDIAMKFKDKDKAIKFGKRILKINIISNGKN